MFNRIKEASQAKVSLANFMGKSVYDTNFVSLGQNCSSAWYLKKVGLKDRSYPFDWVFSSTDIVLDCINDRFEKYLDRALIISKSDNNSAGHSYYHDSLFNHRNPLATKSDYSYYQRCCHRFIELVESKEPQCYLITLINEPSKRRDWARGFNNHFSMPKNQDLASVSKLIQCLKEANENSKFIVVDHYTHSTKPSTFKIVNNHVFSIEFHARGRSTGRYYKNKIDDFCFRLILMGLYGEEKKHNRLLKNTKNGWLFSFFNMLADYFIASE